MTSGMPDRDDEDDGTSTGDRASRPKMTSTQLHGASSERSESLTPSGGARDRAKRPDIGLALMAASAVLTISTGVLLWRRVRPSRRRMAVTRKRAAAH
jgi:hypothetical protein